LGYHHRRCDGNRLRERFGWRLDSFSSRPHEKATFGFDYSCDPSTNHLQGHFEYQDLGAGLRAGIEIDQAVPTSLGCTTLPDVPGVTAACGIVQSGSGGVSPNDIALVATGDGQSIEVEDAMAIALFSGGSASVCTTGIQSCASQPTVDEFLNCLNAFDLGTPYYINMGTLGAGAIVLKE
jgi:hypothetical protein